MADDDTVAQYTFVPWLRQGIAAHINEPDLLGADSEAGAIWRASLSVELVIEYVPKAGGEVMPQQTPTKKVELLGPGDIIGIKPTAVLRTEPDGNAVNATPGELAFVEFYDEDFPWRYTPARAAKPEERAEFQHKLRPWLALFVLRNDEFTLNECPGERPVLKVNDNVPLPPADEAWAWAHAQIGQVLNSVDGVGIAIANEPNLSLSRLMCPRKLEPGVGYTAFVVPAFETGRLVGLKDQTYRNTPAQKPSWKGGSVDQERRFPIYHQWRFQTSTSGDFETLVEKLMPGPAGEQFGTRKMDISDCGFGMPVHPGATVDFEGALCPPDFDKNREAFPKDVPSEDFVSRLLAVVDLRQQLQTKESADLPHPYAKTESLDSSYPSPLRPRVRSDVPDDPVIVPPAYGLWQAGVKMLADAESVADRAWLHELNLDPRNRAAAGLGAEVVRQLQDELMERAWKQVGAIEAANQRLREAELVAAAGESLHAKHLAHASPDRLLMLTSAAQRGIKKPHETDTVRSFIAKSCVPLAAQSAAFKRISRTQRKLMRRLMDKSPGGGMQAAMLQRMNPSPTDPPSKAPALSAAPPMRPPRPTVTIGNVAMALEAARELAAKGRDSRFIFLEMLQQDLASRRKTGQDLNAIRLIEAVKVSVDELAIAKQLPPAIKAEIERLVKAMNAIGADGADAAIVWLEPTVFAVEFGDGIQGKTYRGVTVKPALDDRGHRVLPESHVARTASLQDLQAYSDALGQFNDLMKARPLPASRPAIETIEMGVEPITALAKHVLERLRPRLSVTERVASSIEGLGPMNRARSAETARPLRPVMAYPEFDDPMFEPLQRLSQDYILPNVRDLPKNTITLMEPNRIFIEAFLAGLNAEMGRELMWREFPTDQRGTYFKTFWDTRDAIDRPLLPDIHPMDQWVGPLGKQSSLPDTLVLVIRGELLQKYPNTIVYAQEAEWTDDDDHQKPRKLKPGGVVMSSFFQDELEPDISVFGFKLSEDDARGYRRSEAGDREPERPGWFFVLKERPGQTRFGADEKDPPHGFKTWDDLAWSAVPCADGMYVRVSGADLIPPVPKPAEPENVSWGGSAAQQAYAMFQSPILYARHAAELLPPPKRTL